MTNINAKELIDWILSQKTDIYKPLIDAISITPLIKKIQVMEKHGQKTDDAQMPTDNPQLQKKDKLIEKLIDQNTILIEALAKEKKHD